jgi:hypothetical protein
MASTSIDSHALSPFPDRQDFPEWEDLPDREAVPERQG